MSSSDGAAVAPQDVRTREELGAALTALRLASGLSVRDVARRSGLPLATVGGYLSGRHLPPLATLDQFAGLLTVLAVPDEAAPAWLDAVTRLRRVPGPRPAAAVAPYLGLRAYQADDSALFFGREAATDHLVGLLSSAPGTPVVVVGSSGSGKSSLLRAGVQARLAADGRPVTVVTPGTDPTGVVPEPADLAHGGVLVVDQFEELFTADVAQDQVTAVVAGLGRLHDEGTVVVVALRADFFDAAVQVPELAAWLAATQVLVGPLSTDDLRRVVVEPARVAGVEVDDGLVELLIADATAGSSTRAGLDAGALPLASHALYVTWLAASGRRLTLEQYRQVGRLAGAIAQTAETVHNQLTPEAEAVEKATFLRLPPRRGHPRVRRREPGRHQRLRRRAAPDVRPGAGADRPRGAADGLATHARMARRRSGGSTRPRPAHRRGAALAGHGARPGPAVPGGRAGDRRPVGPGRRQPAGPERR